MSIVIDCVFIKYDCHPSQENEWKIKKTYAHNGIFVMSAISILTTIEQNENNQLIGRLMAWMVWILIGSKQIEIQATTTSDIRNDEKKTSIVYVWIGISITERQRAVTQRFEYQLNKRIIHLLSQFKNSNKWFAMSDFLSAYS